MAYEDLKKKFIIKKNGQMKLAKVKFHRDFVGGDANSKDVLGGGWWNLNEDFTEITFYGLSTDFGWVTRDQILESIWSDNRLPHGLMKVKRVYHAFGTLIEKSAMENRELIHTF